MKRLGKKVVWFFVGAAVQLWVALVTVVLVCTGLTAKLLRSKPRQPLTLDLPPVLERTGDQRAKDRLLYAQQQLGESEGRAAQRMREVSREQAWGLSRADEARARLGLAPAMRHMPPGLDQVVADAKKQIDEAKAELDTERATRKLAEATHAQLDETNRRLKAELATERATRKLTEITLNEATRDSTSIRAVLKSYTDGAYAIHAALNAAKAPECDKKTGKRYTPAERVTAMVKRRRKAKK